MISTRVGVSMITTLMSLVTLITRSSQVRTLEIGHLVGSNE